MKPHRVCKANKFEEVYFFLDLILAMVVATTKLDSDPWVFEEASHNNTESQLH